MDTAVEFDPQMLFDHPDPYPMFAMMQMMQGMMQMMETKQKQMQSQQKP